MRQDFLTDQQNRNSETAGLADSFRSHRDQVMKLIMASADDLTQSDSEQCSSITLLGAGNCLDVNLQTLTKRFKKIHLVDLDADAVTKAVERAGVAEHCEIHAPEDIAEPLLSLTSRDFRSTEEHTEQYTKVLQALTSENGVPDVPAADVVVSLCVFSQIIDCFGRLVTADQPGFSLGLKALRMGHLRRTLNMLRPGGVAVFVSDVVSSVTSEELKTATTETMSALLKKLVNDGNFFSGTNPATVLADLNMLTRLPGGPESVHTIDPWPWQMGDRTYAVYAFRIQKALPAQETEEPESPEEAESTDDGSDAT